MKPVTKGLRPLYNKSKQLVKTEVHIEPGDTLLVSDNVADQLLTNSAMVEGEAPTPAPEPEVPAPAPDDSAPEPPEPAPAPAPKAPRVTAADKAAAVKAARAK